MSSAAELPFPYVELDSHWSRRTGRSPGAKKNLFVNKNETRVNDYTIIYFNTYPVFAYLADDLMRHSVSSVNTTAHTSVVN